MTEQQQVYQCAKVARPAPSQESKQQEDAIDEIHAQPPAKTTNTTPETENNPKSTKENITAALRGFMNMGIYVCGPSRDESLDEDISDEDILQEEPKPTTSKSIDITSTENDYIFEDTSTIEDGHIGASVTIHVITETRSPAPLKSIDEETKEEPPTRLNEDVFQFSDTETEATSQTMHAKEECYDAESEASSRMIQTQEECKDETDVPSLTEEECKEEQPQVECKEEQSESHELLMGNFDLVETNFYGSKKHWSTGPRVISPTRFEI
ncbi:unnamed protein product [Cylindrotheca closterium]|uniref:Uncharacterized protein n=1 Tax=Cylindrotheca closterium TaxID=2856 RepID=A0AAD2JJI5_9STRA|nr:unnamed protein product [Cylindrotheca closterium]